MSDVCSTNDAVHLAAALAEDTSTILVDLDDNPAALDWAAHGRLPFPTYGITEGREAIRHHTGHVIYDAPARPTENTLRRLLDAADMLVIPTPPDALSLTALRRVVGMRAGSRTRYS